MEIYWVANGAYLVSGMLVWLYHISFASFTGVLDCFCVFGNLAMGVWDMERLMRQDGFKIFFLI